MSQQQPFSKEEINALAALKRAFKRCDTLGLKFSGMDNTLLCANSRAVETAKRGRSNHNADYNVFGLGEVAEPEAK